DDPRAGSGWNQMQRAKRQRELGCGYTLYGWDGDNLAWESSPPQDEGETGRTVHYLYEPDSFVPVAQALRKAPIRLLRQPDWRGREYDIDQDPLWQHEVKPQPIDSIAWYQCDHLGTPMELTDHHGEVAWAGQYKAWGDVREVRSEWAKQVGMSNPIRFQGQYHDHETGLHYNRYRYYDPRVGRFVSQDPISYGGGLNLFAYAPNPVEWIDPLGLWKGQPRQSNGRFGAGKDPSIPCPCETETSEKVHGNNLNTTALAVGYTLRDRNDDEKIMKFGETTMGTRRYTKAYLDKNNVNMQIEVSGTKREMHAWQHRQILDYKAHNGGGRPPLNKSDF
ncbi:MAG: RHS repeat-associated core domain-containing protein, partial [Pseudomonas sp.]|uniref:RHS repeat-associated core domain-containing protein n=1 Tax=Pseudomonas TaxID=286 RepID=UPI003D6AD86C